MEVKRLYVVVRSDLPLGLQMAQACHAAREFTLQHQEDVGDNLVVLHASPGELCCLVARAESLVTTTAFHEPDLGGELTAAAFGLGARRLLSHLPLAGRPPHPSPPREAEMSPLPYDDEDHFLATGQRLQSQTI